MVTLLGQIIGISVVLAVLILVLSIPFLLKKLVNHTYGIYLCSRVRALRELEKAGLVDKDLVQEKYRQIIDNLIQN